MIPTQAQYEAREQAEFIRQRNAPMLQTKQEWHETAKEFAADMANKPELVAERVSWLLNGSYGYGSYQQARKVAANTHMTREAWMVQVIGALEWGCREVDTRRAFNRMTAEQKAKLNALVLAEIAYHLNEEKEQQA